MTINTDCSVAPTPVHGVVVFVPADFKGAFPMFATTPDATLVLAFSIATTILNNRCGSVVDDATVRETMLNLLVAHIVTLMPSLTSGGSSGPSIVGVIQSATEGTVSIDAGWMSEVSQSMAWFIQTQWGALFWQMSAPFRSFRYQPPPQCCGPAGPFAGRRY